MFGFFLVYGEARVKGRNVTAEGSIASADFEFTAKESSIYIDEDLNGDIYDRARFTVFLQRSSVVKLLVQLLSNSPCICLLSMGLNVEVWTSYHEDLDDIDEEMDTKYVEASNGRAAEIFMASGILKPLRKLSNVQSPVTSAAHPMRWYKRWPGLPA